MMRVTCGAVIVLAMVGTGADAAVTATGRNQFTFSSLGVSRRDAGGSGSTYETASVFDDFQSSAGTVLPAVQDTSGGGSGTINDTATDSVLVASGNGSVDYNSTLADDGFGGVTGYSFTSNVSASLTTGTLAGYEPSSQGDEVYVEGVTGFNAGLNIVTDAPLPYEFAVSQSNSVGNVFLSGLVYLDFNEDQSYNDADGDVLVENIGLFSDNSVTHNGVLPASAHPYRIFYFGNTFDGTTTDNETDSSSADYSGSFTVVPEPASGIGIALGALVLVRRRR